MQEKDRLVWCPTVACRFKYDSFGHKQVYGLALSQVRCMGVITHRGEKEVCPLEAYNSTQPERNTQEE